MKVREYKKGFKRVQSIVKYSRRHCSHREQILGGGTGRHRLANFNQVSLGNGRHISRNMSLKVQANYDSPGDAEACADIFPPLLSFPRLAKFVLFSHFYFAA